MPKTELLRVLLVEDNDLDARLLDEYFSESDVRVELEHVTHLQSALAKLSQDRFDATLLDLSLPDSHGLDTVERLVALKPHPPIIVLTGLNDNDLALSALRTGAHDYLVKGQIDASSLFRAVRYAVERARAEQALQESEAHNRALLKAIPDLLFQLSPEGVYLDYQTKNPDCDPQNYVGKAVSEVLPAAQAEQLLEHLGHTLENGKSRFEQSLEVDGLPRDFEIRMVTTDLGNVMALVRDITERKRAERSLEQQNAYLGMLHETSLGLMDRLELSELLDSLVKRVVALTAVPQSFIYLVNEDETRLELAARAGKYQHDGRATLKYGEGAVGRVWQTGRTIFFEDYQNLADAFRSDFHTVRSVAATPLLSDGRVRGVLGVATYADTEPISKRSLDLLNDFARLASIAFDNAKLYAAAQNEIAASARQAVKLKESELRYRDLFIASERQATELELLDQIRTLITQQRDLPTLFKTVVDTVADLFGYEQICLSLVNGALLEPRYYRGYEHGLPTLPLTAGVAGRVARSGVPELIGDVSKDPDYIGASPDISSELCVPFFDQERVLGVLNIETDQNTLLTQADLDIMVALSGQVGIAIENARLYEQAQADLKRTHALHQISQAITATDSLSALLHTISYNILYALGAQWVMTHTLDVSARRVTDSASVSVTDEPIEALGFKELWAGLSGFALREGVSQCSPKGETGSPEHSGFHGETHEIGSVVVSPLIFDAKQLGTISVLRHKSQPDFSEDDVRLVEAIANQVVVALEQRRLLDRIEHQAYHDALTGLPNRLLFEDRLEQSIARAKRTDYPFALLFIDLDGFKHVNDTLGHQLGDELLRAVTARLSNIMRESDTLARMGGDEFAFILNDLRQPPDAVRVAERYLELFKAPFIVEGHELFITASIGVCLYPCDGENVDTLLRHSDSAMYRAKHAGKNDVQTFTPDLAEQARKRLTLENQLRRALEREELELHYQPQIDLKTGDWVGFEALLRWRHKERGLVPPGDFIPIAEESSLIVPIGEWVLHQACRQNAAWQQSGHPPVHVAVNISPRQFSRPDFVASVERALDASGIRPEQLELEVTESVVMQDIALVAERLARLRRLGVRVAIDDFGTGYSSLQYLQHLPIDSLKIDRAFVNAISFDKGEETSALAKIIVTMAHTLGLSVIAEGIETEAQLTYLRSLECQGAQGFFFARPLPASEVWQARSVFATLF